MDEKLDKILAIEAFEAGDIELYTLVGVIPRTPRICHDPQAFFKSLEEADASGAWIVSFHELCDFKVVSQFNGIKETDGSTGLFSTAIICPYNTYTDVRHYQTWHEAAEGHVIELKALQSRLSTSARRTIEIANKILATR